MTEELKRLTIKHETDWYGLTEHEKKVLRDADVTFHSYCGVTDICLRGRRVGKAFKKNGVLTFKWF